MFENNKAIRIMFVGDVCLGEYYTSFGHGPRSYANNNNPLDKILSVLAQADFVVGNLETAITNNLLDTRSPESMVLRGDPAHAHFLAKAGFKILQVSNNHTVQHGKKGFQETISILDNLGISAIGLSNQSVHILNLHGSKIGFLAASDVPDNTNTKQNSYQRLNTEFKSKVIEAVANVDHLFVLLHWGLETSTSPMEYQRIYASELAELGVRGVIGQHPHLFYEIWREKDTIIAPSLGDLVFDLGWDERYLKTGILDIELSGGCLRAKVWPVVITNNGCTPIVSGEPIELTDSVKLYDLGETMRGEQARKLRYFFANFLKGNISLKTKFIYLKLKSFLQKNQIAK